MEKYNKTVRGAQGILKMISTSPSWSAFKNSAEEESLKNCIDVADALVQGDSFLSMFTSMDSSIVKDASIVIVVSSWPSTL